LFNYNGLKDIKNYNKKNLSLNNNRKKLNNFKNQINTFNKDRKRSQEIKSLSTNQLFSTYNQISPINNSISSLKNNKNKSNIPSLYKLGEVENKTIENAIKSQMNEKSILKMNICNYQKLHDIKLAVDATKDQIQKFNKNEHNESINYNYKKKSNSQQSLPKVRAMKNKIENKCRPNNYNKINLLGKRNKLAIFENNSLKFFKRNEQSFFNNKSTNQKNYFNDIAIYNNNNSKSNKSNCTFLNIFNGKSQLINMSQEQTDFGSKSKMDYVPLEFLSLQKLKEL
jgi:hypothetical protein